MCKGCDWLVEERFLEAHILGESTRPHCLMSSLRGRWQELLGTADAFNLFVVAP